MPFTPREISSSNAKPAGSGSRRPPPTALHDFQSCPSGWVGIGTRSSRGRAKNGRGTHNSAQTKIMSTARSSPHQPHTWICDAGHRLARPARVFFGYLQNHVLIFLNENLFAIWRRGRFVMFRRHLCRSRNYKLTGMRTLTSHASTDIIAADL